MTTKTVSGVIELRPRVFTECPEYTSLGLRTETGRFVEVFVPTPLVSAYPTQYRTGKRLILTGGEWHSEPETGVGEYVRYWPSTVRYDA